jgi:tetratricopeptide (TPR) repeat protein
MNLIKTLLLPTLAYGIFSCTENQESAERLQRAEAMMEQAPDSALVILEPTKKLSKKQYALWCLLYTQAQDKNNIPHTSDSIIQIAVDYFENKHDRKHLAKAYYYQAIVWYDKNDSPRAQHFFLKALKVAEGSTDHALLGWIYGNLGSLYVYQNLYYDALAYEQKAFQHFSQINDSTNIGFVLRNIGRVYSYNNELDSAIVYYNQALQYATERSRSSIHNDMGILYTQLGRYPEAFKHIRIAMNSFSSKSDILPAYLNISNLYRLTGQNDSAFYYISRSMQSSNLRTRAGSTKCLAYLEKDQGNLQKYADYMEKYLSLHDSICQIEHAENLQHIQSFYNYQQADQEKNFYKEEANAKTIKIYILTTLVSCQLDYV